MKSRFELTIHYYQKQTGPSQSRPAYMCQRGTEINGSETKGTTEKFWIMQSRVIQVIQM
ncbi:hypothetical protein ACHAXS_000979 [Conticribra weissflogii]